ncbi:Transmembrane protein 129 [Strongyloides ratti]|uniref:Transmembrane protein 129 n=1 Tax=Strongyloides ratti TaxID=34506 RepID=A0A090N0K1_STRRB|nr:Transmembrane protein 129 [Strongyloides ratti]CEF70828.1 Transmembrane protein 129 [Strongyloides ratti]
MILYCWLLGGIIYFISIYPPSAFVGTGLTINDFFFFIFNHDYDGPNFISRIIHKSRITLITHIVLASGYFMFMNYIYYINFDDKNIFMLFQMIILYSLAFYVGYKLYLKTNLNNNADDITLQLYKYARDDDELNDIITEIDEYYTNNVPIIHGDVDHTKIIILGNWLFKMELYGAKIAKLDDTELILKETPSDTNKHPALSSLFCVEVRGIDHKYPPFDIILPFNVLEELNSRVKTSINTLLIEKHNKIANTFRQRISGNPKYTIRKDEEIDNCLGCLYNKASVIIRKNCNTIINEINSPSCEECHCRPLWCLRCLALVYESKCGKSINDGINPLFCKANCPTCRAYFCILDVSIIEEA